MSIGGDLQAPYIEGVIDLFEIVHGGTTFKITPFYDDTQAIVWRNAGDSFQPFPLELLDVESGSEGVQPTPTMRLSNLNKIFASIVFTAGDLAGAEVTRYRVLDSYRFGQPDYDAANVENLLVSKHLFRVVQTQAVNKQILELRLTTTIDQPNLSLPKGVATSDRFPAMRRLSTL